MWNISVHAAILKFHSHKCEACAAAKCVYMYMHVKTQGVMMTKMTYKRKCFDRQVKQAQCKVALVRTKQYLGVNLDWALNKMFCICHLTHHFHCSGSIYLSSDATCNPKTSSFFSPTFSKQQIAFLSIHHRHSHWPSFLLELFNLFVEACTLASLDSEISPFLPFGPSSLVSTSSTNVCPSLFASSSWSTFICMDLSGHAFQNFIGISGIIRIVLVVWMGNTSWSDLLHAVDPTCTTTITSTTTALYYWLWLMRITSFLIDVGCNSGESLMITLHIIQSTWNQCSSNSSSETTTWKK